MSYKYLYPWILSEKEIEKIRFFIKDDKTVVLFGKDSNSAAISSSKIKDIYFSEQKQVDADFIVAPNILNSLKKNITKAFFEIAAKNTKRGSVLFVKYVLPKEKGVYPVATFLSKVSFGFFDKNITAIFACAFLKISKKDTFLAIEHHKVSEIFSDVLSSSQFGKLCDLFYFKNKSDYISFPSEKDINHYSQMNGFSVFSEERIEEEGYPFVVVNRFFKKIV